jgi:hypothetical protein
MLSGLRLKRLASPLLLRALVAYDGGAALLPMPVKRCGLAADKGADAIPGAAEFE